MSGKLGPEVIGAGHSFERVLPDELVTFIARWEAWRPTRYADGTRKRETPAGPIGSTVWSIGYGHAEDGDNEPKIIPADMVLTKEQGLAILKADIAKKAHFIDVRVKVPLTTYQFGALTSLCFQYGNGRLDNSGLFHLLNAGNYVDAACEMLDLFTTTSGTIRKGLRFRRAAELAFFLTWKN